MAWKRAGVVLVLVAALQSAPGLLVSVARAESRTSTAPEPSTEAAPSSPSDAPKSSDSVIEATVSFRFCPTKGCDGQEVFIDSLSNHGGGGSNCVKDATSTKVDLRADMQRFTISVIARSGGSCAFEKSYNTWIIAAYGGSKQISRGLIRITQDVPGFKNYYATCAGAPPPTYFNFECEKDGTLSLITSRKDERPPPPPPQYPCPSARSDCYLDIHFDTAACPNFTASLGACLGKSDGDAAPFVVPVMDLPGAYASFAWSTSTKRRVRYDTVTGIPMATMQGTVDEDGAFTVDDAFAFLSPFPNVHWHTPDRPGAPAGTLGGPLVLTFQNGILGADVYIRGYLVRK